MSGVVAMKPRWISALALSLVLVGVVATAGCTAEDSDVASVPTAEPSSSAGAPSPRPDLGQYERTQALEGCLVDAGLPALLTPVDGGEAQIGWAEGHEVLARDSEQWTTILEGPAGEVDPATREAFTDVEGDSLTGSLAPALWVDGKEHTDIWVQCLESSAYTNPTAYLEEDPDEALLWEQRFADATNDWIACARENGLPGLVDVTAGANNGPYGPHAEIPLATKVSLLRSLLEACPNFSEEVAQRQTAGDATLEDDIRDGRVAPNPLVYVQEPEGMQEAANLPEGYDFKSGDGKHYLELQEVLYETGRALEDKYVEQAQKNATEATEPIE